MSKIWKFVFWLILIASLYHFVRDIMQIIGVNNILFHIGEFHPSPKWCGAYCSYVTFPPEIFHIIVSTIVLKRNKVGALGVLGLVVLSFWLVVWFTP